MINKNAFTLIELAISISLVGFLIVGIISINALFKNTIILTTIKDMQSYKSAINTFASVYGNLPGDVDNATVIFGSTDKNGKTVYNGNGDGLIGNKNVNLNLADQEVYSAFQQLSLLQLISGNFNGSISTAAPGVNIPKSVYSLNSIYYIYSNTLWNNYNSFNSLVLSGSKSSGWNDYVIKVRDAYGIDSKIDDGLPLTGNIIAYNHNADKCTNKSIASNPSHSTTTYLQSTSTFCSLHMSLESYGFK
jgi:type II secretory pathway pseudopilin PulG